MNTQKVKVVGFEANCIFPVSTLAMIASALLAVVGCQSPSIRRSNLELTQHTEIHSHADLDAPCLVKPIGLSAESADTSNTRTRPSLKPIFVSATIDQEEYPLVPKGMSSEDANEQEWHFGATNDPLIPNESFYEPSQMPHSQTLLEQLWDDQNNFYSPESVTLLGGGLVVGGLMANTSIDEKIHRHFQSSVRGATSDDWFESLHASKELGNGIYTLPVFATAWAAGELFPNNRALNTSGRWGERSIRGFIVGAPPLIVLQQFTGGSRPGETDDGSKWKPFSDNNGVSGHAFMGSLPFITAAKMTENRGLKALFYASSALTPLSRVNDNVHYPSQVALGWWMAYLAASAVDATDNPNNRWRFYPYSTGNGSGMMAEFRY